MLATGRDLSPSSTAPGRALPASPGSPRSSRLGHVLTDLLSLEGVRARDPAGSTCHSCNVPPAGGPRDQPHSRIRCSGAHSMTLPCFPSPAEYQKPACHFTHKAGSQTEAAPPASPTHRWLPAPGQGSTVTDSSQRAVVRTQAHRMPTSSAKSRGHLCVCGRVCTPMGHTRVHGEQRERPRAGLGVCAHPALRV